MNLIDFIIGRNQDEKKQIMQCLRNIGNGVLSC